MVVPLVHGGIFAVQEVEDLTGKLVDRDASLRNHLQDSLEGVGDCKVAGKFESNVVEGEGVVYSHDSAEVRDSAKGISEVYQALE